MNKHAWWAWAIKNSICVICWTVLAIVFDKWGIALFSLLFLSSLEVPTKRYYRVCDSCGEHSPYAETPDESLKLAKEAGWEHYEGTNTDYCPTCQIKRKKG